MKSTGLTTIYRKPGVVVLACAVAALAFAVREPSCTNDYLRSDAADYFRAVRSGFTPTYLELESNTFPEIIQLYADKSGPGAYPWDHLYRQADASALRHFHVPAALYPHAIAVQWRASNRAHRLIAAITGSVFCGLLVLLLLSAGLPLLYATGTAILVALNPAFIQATVDVSPHPAYIFLAVAYLFALSHFLRTASTTALVLAATLLGCAIAVLELSPALVVASVAAYICGRWRGTVHDVSPLRTFAIATGVVLITTAVVWPGGFTRGGYLKAYGVFMAQALLKRDELFGSVSLQTSLYDRLFQQDIVLALVCALALAGLAVLFLRRRIEVDVAVIGLYTAIAFGLNLGNGFRNPTYASEVVVFAIIATPFFFDRVSQLVNRKAVAAIFLAVVAWSGSRVLPAALRQPGSLPADAVAQAIHHLPTLLPSNATILVNSDREAYAAYLSQYRFEATEEASSLRPRPLQRSTRFEFLMLDASRLQPETLKHVREEYLELGKFAGETGGRQIILVRTKAGAEPSR